jgi:hypothetical protein
MDAFIVATEDINRRREIMSSYEEAFQTYELVRSARLRSDLTHHHDVRHGLSRQQAMQAHRLVLSKVSHEFAVGEHALN